MRAAAAWDSERISEEIIPVEVKVRGRDGIFERDEHMRPDTNPKSLAGLKPYFKADGTVTAGNASGIVDGAASLVLASAEKTRSVKSEPLGRLVAWETVGVEPAIMGIGPAPAAEAVLEKAKLTLDDMDLIEINEAFSTQYLAVEKQLELDRLKTNVNGGSIAIGHPLGATGARLTLTILHELRRTNKKYGLAAACIGGGQGMAVIVEAI
jgi:acetyl-CoA acetyltransferase family protein